MIDSNFDNDFWDDAEVELKGKEVYRETDKGINYVIRADGLEVDEEQGEKMVGSLRLAFNWEEKVLGGKARERFWKKGEISLTLRDKMEGFMQNNFDIKAGLAFRKSKETVAAAIFHEVVEMWRDEEGLIGEGAPLMAEFLMCEKDRLLFKELCDNYREEDDAHQIGWNKVVNRFGFGKENNGNLFEEMNKWKEGLNEEQKLNFIKTDLLDWKQI